MKRYFIKGFSTLVLLVFFLLNAKAQTEFSILSKDTIYTVVSKNVPVISPVNIVNHTGATLQLSYSLLSSHFDANWDIYNCDNLECYAKLNPGTKMDTFGGSRKHDTTFFDVDETFGGDNADTAIVRYSVYDPVHSAQARIITWVFYSLKTGIETAPAPVSISVFPNPTGNSIRLGVKAGEAYKNLEIVSMTGARVYSQASLNADEDLNVSSFTPGLYIVRFSDKSGNLFQGRFQKIN